MSAPIPNVVIATPCYGGLMTHVYVNSLLQLMGASRQKGYNLALFTAAHDSLITRSRNALVKSFLDATAATHLFFVDADIGFEPSAVSRMLAFDQDVVCGMYPVKVIDWARVRTAAHPGTTDDDLREAGLHFVGVPCTGPEHEEKDGFVTGKYAGTGFMLIKRSVIERMVRAYPELEYRTMQTYPSRKAEGAPYTNLFDCLIEPGTGVYLSEDFAFCHRFRQIGGKIWLDTRSRLRHVGSMEFEGRPELEFMKYGAALTGEPIAAE